MKEITNETELVGALSARKRYLEYGVKEDGTVGYTVVEEQAGAPVVLTCVDEGVARGWIASGPAAVGPYRSTHHLPEHSGFREVIDCGEDFIKGDTVQWRESAFERRGGGKPKYIGRLQVLAKVTWEDRHGWVRLQVIECEVVQDKAEGAIKPLRVGREIKRARRTIGRFAQRLPWADEAMRDRLVEARAQNG